MPHNHSTAVRAGITLAAIAILLCVAATAVLVPILLVISSRLTALERQQTLNMTDIYTRALAAGSVETRDLSGVRAAVKDIVAESGRFSVLYSNLVSATDIYSNGTIVANTVTSGSLSASDLIIAPRLQASSITADELSTSSLTVLALSTSSLTAGHLHANALMATALTTSQLTPPAAVSVAANTALAVSAGVWI